MSGSEFMANAVEKPIDGTPYRIVDENGYRFLMVQGDDAALHSAMPLSGPDALVIPYTVEMLRALTLARRLD